ncbi:hypothetical protein AKJ09_05638 [Labilithrix luteola]|uniref:Uncharacterized protein n=1 Tax=Labilithrix luteola TaxID=1391654 RepID=A0A0K1Q0N7_9BACT|nr:hypothetical protein AKJ09_05638 [Labilithrix luteola]
MSVVSLARGGLAWGLGVAAFVGVVSGCSKPQRHYTTTVEVGEVQHYGQAAKGGSITDLELKFVDCPGDARKYVRADKGFGQCNPNIKEGEHLEAEVVAKYNSESNSYRSELVRLGGCPMRFDPTDEANYEIVQTCTDLEASGVVVGVRCDRSRSKELVAKCPWFRR